MMYEESFVNSETVVFYGKWFSILSHLPETRRVTIYETIINYGCFGKEPSVDALSGFYELWLLIKIQIDEAKSKRNSRIKKQRASYERYKERQKSAGSKSVKDKEAKASNDCNDLNNSNDCNDSLISISNSIMDNGNGSGNGCVIDIGTGCGCGCGTDIDSGIGSGTGTGIGYGTDLNNFNLNSSSINISEKKKDFVPSLEEVLSFAKENGWEEEWAHEFYKNNSYSGWKDKHGNPIGYWTLFFANFVKPKIKEREESIARQKQKILDLKAKQEESERNEKRARIMNKHTVTHDEYMRSRQAFLDAGHSEKEWFEEMEKRRRKVEEEMNQVV